MCKICIQAYRYLIEFGGLFKSPLLLICRLYFGSVFFLSGLHKFQDIGKLTRLLESYHLWYPTEQAYTAASIELIGGICLILGFASRLVAIPLIIVMVTAYFTIHIDAVKGIFSSSNAFVTQAPFIPLLISIIVLAFGPGRYSIDHYLEKKYFH